MECRLKSHRKQYGVMLEKVSAPRDQRDVILCPKSIFAQIDKPLSLINITSLNWTLDRKCLQLAFAYTEQDNHPLTYIQNYS